MKKWLRNTILTVIALLAAFIYYYITLPAINIHSKGFWYFILFAIAVVMLICVLRKAGQHNTISGMLKTNTININFKQMKSLKGLAVIFGVLCVVFLMGNILSSPIVNAKKYQQLLTIEEREFAEDIKEVDYKTIPLLDKNSAAILGNRKMGSMKDMVSQFEVGDDYTQINYRGTPVRVTPLVYATPIKWLTNQKEGIPAYIMIDMATQDTECIRLEQGIKYSKSEYFNRNLYRHLRFNYPTYIFDEQIVMEIDDEGTPYWVCPVRKFNIGLFGGQTISKVVLCNAITGECVEYEAGEIPQWIDKVFSAELLIQLYDYAGTLKHGFWNSILSQKDCLQTTNGYNYIALEDDVWVYTGVTSVSSDQSNVGFVLMNQRTMETRFYTVEGAIEESAMGSAQGQVQDLGYAATFPLLLNIAGEPTYFMALKDSAGLVKVYAMVNVQKYQWVAIGNTVKECEKSYIDLLNINGITSQDASDIQTVTGEITAIASVVIEGTTHYYICLSGIDGIFDCDLLNTELLDIIRYRTGDVITFTYIDEGDLNSVLTIDGKKQA